jgi:hypothetical protein
MNTLDKQPEIKQIPPEVIERVLNIVNLNYKKPTLVKPPLEFSLIDEETNESTQYSLNMSNFENLLLDAILEVVGQEDTVESFDKFFNTRMRIAAFHKFMRDHQDELIRRKFILREEKESHINKQLFIVAGTAKLDKKGRIPFKEFLRVTKCSG